MRRTALAFLVLITASVTAFAQSLPSWSIWKNQRGSILKVLAVAPDQTFTGIYINNEPGFACQGTPFNLTGRASGSKVTFTVLWKNAWQDCKSKTVWYGFDLGPTMPTKWTLTSASGTLTGFDQFTLQPF
jgi:hypothetical protein